MANAGSSVVPLLVSSSTSSHEEEAAAAIDGTAKLRPLLNALLVALAWAFDAQQVFISAFTDAEPPWHCLNTIAVDGDGDGGCSTTSASPPCSSPPGTSWAWDGPAEASVVSEWSLGCGGPAAASFLVSLPASSFFAGCVAGGFLLAALADSRRVGGRRNMLLASLASMSAAGAVTAAAPNVWAYAALRFASGFARSMVGPAALVLATELVGGDSGRRRHAVSSASFACFAAGFMSLPALAYVLRDASWRAMYLCTSLPCVAYTLLLFFVVPESPRWLLVAAVAPTRDGVGGGAFAALRAVWAR